jgi:glutamine synthetase
MVARYLEHGLSIRVGMEAECTLFRRTSSGDYEPADTDGMFTLSGLDRHDQLWHEIVDTLRQMGVVVDQLGKEYGPGQYEMTSVSATPLQAADDYLTIKEVVRALTRRAGLIASYMPKPFAHLPGNGLHVHMSLWDRTGERDLSCGETPDQPLSALGRQFVAGLLAHAPALAGIGASTVNSYKRLLPGSWAPAHICWGVGNRAALVRVPGMGARRRFEFRAGDNACNPFLYLTALLAAGLDGIERQLEPPPPIADDIGHLDDDAVAARNLGYLPRTLPDALDALEQDSVITQALGSVIATELLKVRRTELAAYEQHVHPWERATYLEAL